MELSLQLLLMGLNGFEWNQAELEPLSLLNEGLISILSFDSVGRPIPIGTGFILAVLPKFAFGCTAAHNFAEIRNSQQPLRQHHSSALREFLPESTPLDLDRSQLRAVYFCPEKSDFAVFGWAASDEKSDIAFFSVMGQDAYSPNPFEAVFEIDESIPEIGDEIAALGYTGSKIKNEYRDGSNVSFMFGRQLILRRGRVTGGYPDGHRLCKGPCIETTIPVFPGMSGGPVFRIGSDGEPMRPFGLISSDTAGEPADKWNRSIPGSSIVPLISSVISKNELGQRESILRLDSDFVVHNKAELSRIGS